MLPSSFLAGTTTETEYFFSSARGFLLGRASMQLVMAMDWNGHNFTRNLLKNGSNPGSAAGSKTSPQDLMTSKSDRFKRLATSSGVSQFCSNTGFANPAD